MNTKEKKLRETKNILFFSTVQPTSRSIDDNEEATDGLFTLNEADEISDDEPIDDQSDLTAKTQHIRDNFKVDDERGERLIKFQTYFIHRSFNQK